MTEDRPGLRERKKALTRLLLRERARALFAAQGYDTQPIETVPQRPLDERPPLAP